MILPINKEPGINAYLHHACVNAMIGNRELLRLKVPDSIEKKWKEYVNDSEFGWKGEFLSLKGIKNEINTESCIVRKCNVCDEFIIQIQYIKKQEFTLSLMISEDAPMECFHTGQEFYKLGMNKYGLMFIKKYILNDSIEVNNYSWLKIVRRNTKVYSYISDNGSKWFKVDEERLVFKDSEKQYSIGITADFGANQYFNWKYMNYIQLFYNVNDIYGKMWLDYYFFPKKNIDYGFQSACHFLNTEYLEMKEITDLFGDINDFIHWSIDHYYYVSICLDEFYIPDRLYYQSKHYLHYNLIYGYDDENKRYALMGYKDKLIASEIPMQLLKQAVLSNSEVVRYRLNINTTKLSFDIKRVAGSIKEYIEGADSSGTISNILAQREGVYGLRIFHELIDTERGSELLINDKRITYLLFEHCKIMEERLLFLFGNNYLDINSREYLTGLCRKMVLESERLKNLFLKNRLTKREEANMLNKAEALYAIEKEFYSSLYEALKSYNKIGESSKVKKDGNI